LRIKNSEIINTNSEQNIYARYELGSRELKSWYISFSRFNELAAQFFLMIENSEITTTNSKQNIYGR